MIVGARCAGAATAALLARRGARVLLVERGQPGTDTLSTHALMRGAVVQLHRWGLLPAVRAAGTPPISTTAFDYGGETLAVAISTRHGVDALYAPRRTVLDRILVDAARDAGADVRVRPPADRTSSRRVWPCAGRDRRGRRRHRCTTSAPAWSWAPTAAIPPWPASSARPCFNPDSAATATVYGHWNGVSSAGYRWLYALDASAGVIPTNDGAACVFVTVPAARFAATFRGDVAAGFQRAPPSTRSGARRPYRQRRRRLAGLHGFGGQVGRFTRSHGPGWALVGDAAYFKDPLTAHGITDALLHAELLADAIVAGGETALSLYEATRTTLATPVFDATEAIAGFAWSFDQLRQLHTRLARAMADEIDAALAAFREPAGDLAPAWTTTRCAGRRGAGCASTKRNRGRRVRRRSWSRTVRTAHVEQPPGALAVNGAWRA